MLLPHLEDTKYKNQIYRLLREILQNSLLEINDDVNTANTYEKANIGTFMISTS